MIRWQVIADYNYIMTVAFFLNDELSSIITGPVEDIIYLLKLFKLSNKHMA